MNDHEIQSFLQEYKNLSEKYNRSIAKLGIYEYIFQKIHSSGILVQCIPEIKKFYGNYETNIINMKKGLREMKNEIEHWDKIVEQINRYNNKITLLQYFCFLFYFLTIWSIILFEIPKICKMFLFTKYYVATFSWIILFCMVFTFFKRK
jgi:hypothetical protein